MVDDRVAVRTAVETAWFIYRSTHPGIHAADYRRCLLERHLQGRSEAREGELEELAGSGLAYLARLSAQEC